MSEEIVKKLSYSSISSYLTCGLWWKFRYVDKVPTSTSTALLLGGVFHNTVEKFVTDLALTNTAEPLVEIWKTEWDKKLEEEGSKVDWQEETPESVEAEGRRLMESPSIFQTLLKVNPQVINEKVSIEKQVEFFVPEVELPIVGYIDIIEEDGVPGDFKTASMSWNEKKALEELQPLFYIAGLEQNGFEDNPEMKFRHFVFVKTKTPKAQIIETKRHRGELDFLFEIIQRVWQGIKSETFVPNPTTWKCSEKYCEFWGICRGKSLS